MSASMGPMEFSRQGCLHHQTAIQVWNIECPCIHWILSNCKCFREFEKHFYELWLWELSKVVEITGCKKPCSYKEYKLGEERVEPEDLPAGQMKFGLWSSTELTNIETEVLLYPFTSLLAEFGGTLGLFLGFSFITIWDGFQATLVWINKREFHWNN